MVRLSATLVLIALAGVGHACPWWGRPCRPAPVVVYTHCPPPVIVYHPYPLPAPAPAEPPKAAPAPDPAPKELDPEALYKKAVRSCVFLVTPIKGGRIEADGVLIDAEKRLVLTSYEAVGENDLTFVQFPVRLKDESLMTDLKRYLERIPAGQANRGRVLYRDKVRNLALAQLDRLPPDTSALPLAEASVRPGATVHWIGHVASANQTFATATGVVRYVGVLDFVVGGPEGMRTKAKMLAITNPTPGGANGGPIIDKRGQMVGLTVRSPGLQNISHAVDVTEIRAFLAEKKVNLK